MAESAPPLDGLRTPFPALVTGPVSTGGAIVALCVGPMGCGAAAFWGSDAAPLPSCSIDPLWDESRPCNRPELVESAARVAHSGQGSLAASQDIRTPGPAKVPVAGGSRATWAASRNTPAGAACAPAPSGAGPRCAGRPAALSATAELGSSPARVDANHEAPSTGPSRASPSDRRVSIVS